MMNSNRRYPPYGINFAAGFLIIAGWGGLYYLVHNIRPTAGPRWYFFILLNLAIVGTSLPLIRFLNMRFSRNPQTISNGLIFRQSLWVGLYTTVAAWLQILRVLSPIIAFLLAMVFVTIEAFLRVRENMHYYADE